LTTTPRRTKNRVIFLSTPAGSPLIESAKLALPSSKMNRDKMIELMENGATFDWNEEKLKELI
jgi:hypothetical protein